MKIELNKNLKSFNTFGIEVFAKQFVSVSTLHELQEVISKEKNIFLLGGGSNMLLTKDISELVVHLNLKGISIVTESENNVYIKAEAGENWHDFVIWCIDHDYGGLENLSLIPGNVGTSPIQNIGAYGVELKDVFHQLEAINLENGASKTFNLDDCNFGYRNSVFKNIYKGKYLITSVTFKLTKHKHKINTSYGVIKVELDKKKISSPTLKDISDAVIKIRESKLPNPKEIGNSGSFFKNPIISKEHFNTLQKKYPSIPFYTVSETEIKVPAGWIIEQSGFKGKRFGDAGVHDKQALVLVNYENANGASILELARLIQTTIFKNFNINLEFEVNIF